jgi:hypothetical protein
MPGIVTESERHPLPALWDENHESRDIPLPAVQGWLSLDLEHPLQMLAATPAGR